MTRLRTAQWRFGAVFLTAAVLAGALIGASQVGADEATAGEPVAAAAPKPAAKPKPSLFTGIRQRGAALGSPTAPVTLVEYADLQCPFCADWARNALPTVVKRYVRAGKVRIVFRGLAFIGEDSDTALRTVIAAGRQNHLWDVLHGLFMHQGGENAGWVTDELIREIAAEVPGVDAERLLDERSDGSVETAMKRDAEVAQVAGIQGTPSFQLGPTGGTLVPVQPTSLEADGIVPLIEEVLRGE
jgi:protein-disulfide isomerase